MQKSRPRQLYTTVMAVAVLSALCLGLGATSGADQPAASIAPLELHLQKFQHYKSSFPGTARVPSTPATSFAAIDACIQSGIAQYGVPGAAVAILDGSALVYEQGYGVKHQEQGGAVDPDTLFRFGSILKMMTSAAVMQQVEKGQNGALQAYYGYGILRLPDFQGVDLLFHDGAVPGWTAALLWIPARQFVVAVLYNAMGDPTSTAICAVDAVVGLSGDYPPDNSRDPSTWDRYTSTYKGRCVLVGL